MGQRKEEGEGEREGKKGEERKKIGVKVRSKEEEHTYEKEPGNPSWPTFWPGV